MNRNFFWIFAVFALLFLSAGAADAKMRVAVIFSNKTTDPVPVDAVTKFVRDAITSADIFVLASEEETKNALESKFGFEARARNFDAFSAARFGRNMKVDAILIGNVTMFEKNKVPNGMIFKINGVDVSKSGADVIIEATLLDAKGGAALVSVSAESSAFESALDDISSSVRGGVSPAFSEALKKCAVIIVNELRNAVPK